jgi:hypothetical protein
MTRIWSNDLVGVSSPCTSTLPVQRLATDEPVLNFSKKGILNPGGFGDFGQIPGPSTSSCPSSSLFGRVLLRFPRILVLTGESYYSTSWYVTVYKKKYPSTGIPCTAVRVFGLKTLFWKVTSTTLRIIKTYNPYTKILNFVLLIWEERNAGRYEHTRACRARARAARAKKNST